MGGEVLVGSPKEFSVERVNGAVIEYFAKELEENGEAILWNESEMVPGIVGFYGLDNGGKWALAVDVHRGQYKYWSAGNRVVEGSFIYDSEMRHYFIHQIEDYLDAWVDGEIMPQDVFGRLMETIWETGEGYGFPVTNNADRGWNLGSVDLSGMIKGNGKLSITPRPNPREETVKRAEEGEDETSGDRHEAMMGKVVEAWVEAWEYLKALLSRGNSLTQAQQEFLGRSTLFVPPLNDTLREVVVSRLPCSDYYDRHYGEGYGESADLYMKLYKGAFDLSKKLEEYRAQAGLTNSLVLREMGLAMPPSQFGTIDNGLRSPELSATCRRIGFQDAYQLAWNVATNPEYVVNIGGVQVMLRDIAIAGKGDMARKLGSKYSEWKPIIDFVKAAAIGYEPWEVVKYGHNGHDAITWRDVDKQLRSMSGRCDLVSFKDGGNTVASRALGRN